MYVSLPQGSREAVEGALLRSQRRQRRSRLQTMTEQREAAQRLHAYSQVLLGGDGGARDMLSRTAGGGARRPRVQGRVGKHGYRTASGRYYPFGFPAARPGGRLPGFT